MPTRVFATRAHTSPSPRARTALWLRDHRPQTVLELAAILNQTPEQIQLELEELRAVEAVAVAEPSPDGVLRFRYHGDDAVVAGIDIGPHSQRIALCDLNGTVRFRQDRRADHAGDLLDRVKAFTDWLHECLDEAGVPVSDLWAVTFAVPGTVGADGRVVESPVVPNWSGIDLAARLHEELDCPVQLVNDGSLSAIAESLLGLGSLMRDFVNVCVGRRVCVRQVLDGRPYEGVNGLAGSVAHLFGERVDTHGQIAWRSDTNGAAVLDRALAGEPDAVEEVGFVIDGLADGIAQVLLTVNPEGVVVGGSIGSRLKPWQEVLEVQVAQRLRGLQPQVELRFSSLGQDTVLAGATVLALEHATSARLGEAVGAPVPDLWRRS